MALLRRTGAAALLVFALAPASSAAQTDPQQVGQVVLAAPRVTGRYGGRPPGELRKQSPVFVNMEVETFAQAGTRIAINTDLPRKGMVVFGPLTTVEFTQRLVNQALGLKEMSWLVKLGQFRLALLPPPAGAALEEGEYLIETPDKTQIRLRGTDVVVRVARDGTTTVWVLEGEVEVKAASGGMVQVPAGYRTRVRRHGVPERPVPFVQGTEPQPDLPAPPGETLFPDPPRLELRLDLPT